MRNLQSQVEVVGLGPPVAQPLEGELSRMIAVPTLLALCGIELAAKTRGVGLERALGKLPELVEEGVHVDGAADEAMARLARLPPAALAVVDEAEIAEHLSLQAPVVAVRDAERLLRVEEELEEAGMRRSGHVEGDTSQGAAFDRRGQRSLWGRVHARKAVSAPLRRRPVAADARAAALLLRELLQGLAALIGQREGGESAPATREPREEAVACHRAAERDAGGVTLEQRSVRSETGQQLDSGGV